MVIAHYQWIVSRFHKTGLSNNVFASDQSHACTYAVELELCLSVTLFALLCFVVATVLLDKADCQEYSNPFRTITMGVTKVRLCNFERFERRNSSGGAWSS